MRDTIGQLIVFLEFNPNAFSFKESIIWMYNFATIVVVFYYYHFLFPIFSFLLSSPLLFSSI